MISRIGWIAVSYATRPLVLALTGLGILFLALGMIPNPIRSNEWVVYLAAPQARLMVNSKVTLDAVRKSGRQQEVDGIDFPRLWIDLEPPKIDPEGRPYHSSPDDAFYKILEEFPNLRSVHYSCYGEPTGMERIVSLAQLETLSLDGFGFFDLAPLRTLRNLRRLEIGLFETQKYVNGVLQQPPKLEGLGALTSLPKLDTLVLRTRSVVNDAVLTEVGSLPHLAVLVLDLADSPRTPLSATQAGFDALARAPALQTLYVGGRFPEDYTELAALAKASAPRLWIYSSRHDSKKTIPLTFLMPCFWFAMAIGVQLSSQFLGSGSRLVPRFASSHALVGVVLSAGVIVFGAARLMKSGLSGPVAIVASAALVTSIIALGATSALTRAFRPRGIQRLTWIIPVLFVCVLVSFVFPAWDPLASALNSPMAVIAYALVACGATVLAVWTLANRAEWFSGSSSLERRNPMGSEWLGVGGRGRWMFFTNRRERQIEVWLPTTRNPNWWQRVQRWRLGNPPYRPLSFTLVMLGTFVVTTWVITRLSGTPRSSSPFPFALAPYIIFLVVGMLVQVSAFWRARLLVLPLEFLRPYSRRALQRELAAALALDLLPLAILFAIVATLGIHLATSASLSWRWAPLSFLYFLVLGCSGTLAMGALVVLVRRLWVSIVLLIVFMLANMFGGNGLFLFQLGSRDFFPSFMTSGLILGQFLLPILSGVILCWVLWRRWLRIEIGQRA
jgi:hypothetical protein